MWSAKLITVRPDTTVSAGWMVVNDFWGSVHGCHELFKGAIDCPIDCLGAIKYSRVIVWVPLNIQGCQ